MNRIFRVIGGCCKLHDRVSNWALVLMVVLGILLACHYWYSLSVSHDLMYPETPRTLVLREQESIVLKRGILQEEHIYGLGRGEYVEVLANEDGSFFLAPILGFYKEAKPKNGYAVGGIFVPRKPSDDYFVWEWPLKNENRSFESPSAARVLSMDRDPPEREWFLDPEWYGRKGGGILRRPLIDTDFKIPRAKFDEGK